MSAAKAVLAHMIGMPGRLLVRERQRVFGPTPETSYENLVALVERIRTSETAEGMESLYRIFSRGARYYLCRHLSSQEIEDKIHDTFLLVVGAIQRGELREPERLMGFVRTIIRRQVAAHIDRAVNYRRDHLDADSSARVPDPHHNPEDGAIFQQRIAMIEHVLAELSPRDREILTRFYLREQSQVQICSEMGLSETQFRLLKSRAKSRFGELGKKKLAQKAVD